MKSKGASSPVEKSPAQEQPHEVAAILEIRRDELKPEIRKYADNLHAQILEGYREFGVKDSEEFEAAARVGTVPTKKLRDLVALTEKLAQVLEMGEEKEVVEALRLFNLAKETVEQIRIDDDDDLLIQHRAEAYVEIAGSEQESGLDFSQSLEDAKDAVERIEREYEQSRVLLEIVSIELRAGKFDEAKDTIQKIKIDARRNLANIAFILAQGGDDRFERAKTLAEKFKIGDDVSDHDKKIYPYAFFNIALAEEEAGQDPKQSFEKAIAVARRLEQPQERSRTYIYLIQAERDAECFDLAKQTVASFNPDFAAQLYANIAFAEARAGQDYRDTLQLARDIADNKKNFDHLAEVEAQFGDFDEARITALKDSRPIEALIEIALIESKARRDPSETLEAAKIEARKTPEPTLGRLNSRFIAWTKIAKAEADIGVDLQESLHNAMASFGEWQLNGSIIGLIEYVDLIGTEATAGDIEEAKKMANRLKGETKDSAYYEIAFAQLNTGKFAKLKGLISEIKGSQYLGKIAEWLAITAAEKITGRASKLDFLEQFHSFNAT